MAHAARAEDLAPEDLELIGKDDVVDWSDPRRQGLAADARGDIEEARQHLRRPLASALRPA